jgi:1,4-dihydroxy-2-naphthoyl-CoA synthase
MIEELQTTLLTVRDDASVRAAVLTGAGRGFCSGADLKARERVKPSEASPDASKAGAERLQGTYNPVILAIRTIEKPFIVAVNGVAAGAGCNLAVACDIMATMACYATSIPGSPARGAFSDRVSLRPVACGCTPTIASSSGGPGLYRGGCGVWFSRRA